MAFVSGNRRIAPREISTEEVEKMKLINTFADEVVKNMQIHGLTPDDWDQLQESMTTKVIQSTKQVWK